MSKDYFGLLLLWGGTILYGLATCYSLFYGTEHYVTSLVLPLATIFFLWKRREESGIFLRVAFFTQFIYYSCILLFIAGIAIPMRYYNDEKNMWFLGGLQVAFLAAWIFSSKRRELFSTEEEKDRGKKKLAVIVLAICIPIFPVIEHFARPILDPQVINNKEAVRVLYFSQDGNWLGVDNVYSVSLWDITKRESSRLMPSVHKSVNSMAIGSGLNYVAIGQYADKNNIEEGGVELVAVKSGERKRIIPNDFFVNTGNTLIRIDDIACSPDDRHLAAIVAGEKKSLIYIWNISDGNLICMIEPDSATGGYKKLAYSPNGENVAASSSDNEVGIWDATTGKLVRVVSKKFHGTLQGIKYSPDGKYLAIASKKSLPVGDEKTGTHKSYIEIWDVESGELYQSLNGEENPINRFSYSYDGKYIATCNLGDNFAEIWDIESGKVIDTFDGPEIPSILGGGIQDVIFSPDGRYLAVASGKYIKLYDARKIGK